MKTSKVWKLEKDTFQKLIDDSSSFRDVLKKIGLSIVSGNYETLHTRIKTDNINTDKLSFNRTQLRKTWHPNTRTKVCDNDVFVENSKCGRNDIKKRIISQTLIPHECSLCKLKNEWNGTSLVLILDHKNGINNDHRLENLRFLCPNCNSQTSTFAGRNNKKSDCICPTCNRPYSGYGKMCFSCYKDNQPTKFNVSITELKTCINQKKSFRFIGKLYGVSGNTVKKRCKKLGIF